VTFELPVVRFHTRGVPMPEFWPSLAVRPSDHISSNIGSFGEAVIS
jgi:hypothetical protein